VPTTGDSSDHPMLLSDGRPSFLSWQEINLGVKAVYCRKQNISEEGA